MNYEEFLKQKKQIEQLSAAEEKAFGEEDIQKVVALSHEALER